MIPDRLQSDIQLSNVLMLRIQLAEFLKRGSAVNACHSLAAFKGLFPLRLRCALRAIVSDI